MGGFEAVLRGGRVIDPESGLDGVRDVGIDGASIGAVSATPLDGRNVVDVGGLGAGTFGRALRTTVREQRAMDLPEAIRRCTLVPADVLGAGVPAMREEGRVRADRDADLTVLDPETVSDRSTYTDTTRPSTGFRHVIVNGTFIVRDGTLNPTALPGGAWGRVKVGWAGRGRAWVRRRGSGSDGG